MEITVDASLHLLGYATATIYGPHEYLLPIGSLDEGEYHLILNLALSSVFSDQATQATGFIEFVVHAVPEPTSVVYWSSLALAFGISRCPKARNRLMKSDARRDCRALD
jgi:hypothetical protein